MSSTFFLFLFAPLSRGDTRSDSAVNYICMYIPKIMIKEISCMEVERMFTEAEISILEWNFIINIFCR